MTKLSWNFFTDEEGGQDESLDSKVCTKIFMDTYLMPNLKAWIMYLRKDMKSASF